MEWLNSLGYHIYPRAGGKQEGKHQRNCFISYTWESKRLESISGHVLQRETTQDETQIERRDLSVQSEFGRHQWPPISHFVKRDYICFGDTVIRGHSWGETERKKSSEWCDELRHVSDCGRTESRANGSAKILFFFWKVHARRSHTPAMMSLKTPPANRNDCDEARRLWRRRTRVGLR